MRLVLKFPEKILYETRVFGRDKCLNFPRKTCVRMSTVLKFSEVIRFSLGDLFYHDVY